MIDGVPQEDPTLQLLTIGNFARLTRLTTKALRIYDQTDLLRPAHVDQSSGYRLYSFDQVDDARLIGLLRGAEVGLAEIRTLLTNGYIDRELATDRLSSHLKRLEAQHTSRRSLIRHIHAVLREESTSMFTIHSRCVPAQRVMSIQRRLHAHETEEFVAEAKSSFSRHLDGLHPTGPFTLIFHGIVDHESDGPIEAVLGCPDEIAPSEVIGIRTEPAHDEAFTTITKAQWDYPAILAAYDAVAASPESIARPGSKLSCREVYVAEPETINDDDLICDIAFPLAEPRA